jgi:hypothetical protein
MAWLGFKLLRAGKWIGRGFAALFRWIFADWRNGPLLMLGLLAAAHIFLIDPDLRADRAAAERARDKAKADLEDEQEAHAATVAGYRTAAEIARKRSEANVERVKAEQAAITEEIVNDYRTRIADARARAAALEQRLRAGTPGADPGRAGTTDVPRAGPAPGGADAAPAQDRLPASGGLSLEDSLIATEQAIQLDELITWVEAQSSVSFSPQAPAGASAPLASAPVGATAGRPCGPAGRDCSSEISDADD